MTDKRELIPHGRGNFVIHGYDTERDLKKAKADIERFCSCLASESIYDIINFLAPYRAQMAKREQGFYDAETTLQKLKSKL